MATELRNLTFSTDSKQSGVYNSITISAKVNGNQVGYLKFDVDTEDKVIEVSDIFVDSKYQNLGVGTALYKQFGSIYNSQYNGFGVSRYYVNPVAEYAFRKAVGLGWISENAISEDMTERETNEQNRDLWKDLRNKLPDNVKGPETWAKKKDRRRFRG